MFSSSTQMKYWTFPSQAELDQLRKEANHRFIGAHYDGDMEADVSLMIFEQSILDQLVLV